jgi:hypothetical protein
MVDSELGSLMQNAIWSDAVWQVKSWLSQRGVPPQPVNLQSLWKLADSSITLEPDPVEDLEEELIEIGFSPEAAAWIVRKVPMWAARQP